MSEQEFLKKSFKPFSLVLYTNDRLKNIDNEYGATIECFLLAVDFDERLFKLIPLPQSWYDEKEFWARCEHCEISRPKLKILKK